MKLSLPFTLAALSATALAVAICLAVPAHAADVAICDGGLYDSDALTCSADFAASACAAASNRARCVGSATVAAMGVYRKANRDRFTCSTDSECNAVNARAARAAAHVATRFAK